MLLIYYFHEKSYLSLYLLQGLIARHLLYKAFPLPLLLWRSLSLVLLPHILLNLCYFILIFEDIANILMPFPNCHSPTCDLQGAIGGHSVSTTRGEHKVRVCARHIRPYVWRVERVLSCDSRKNKSDNVQRQRQLGPGTCSGRVVRLMWLPDQGRTKGGRALSRAYDKLHVRSACSTCDKHMSKYGGVWQEVKLKRERERGGSWIG